MKGILFFFAFIFAVVCYASPPPGEQPVTSSADVGCQFASAAETVVPVMLEAQEVAYIYRGNCTVNYAPLSAEKPGNVIIPVVQMFTVNYSSIGIAGNPPPLLRAWHVVTYNFTRDLQFSNYGYPISMN